MIFQNSRSYTLVEIILVLLVLTLLVTITTPRFNRYSKEAAANTTKANLENLRAAIQMYYDDQQAWPPDTMLYDKLVDKTTWPYKQYIAAIPRDGFQKNNQIYSANTMDNAGGWVYNSTTGKILPNLVGNDAYGKSFVNY